VALKETGGRHAPHWSMTLRLTPAIGRMLEEPAERMGVSKTAAAVNAIRDRAKKEGVPEKYSRETEEQEQ
jgi:hypothetical protein